LTEVSWNCKGSMEDLGSMAVEIVVGRTAGRVVVLDV
jgi:hypothetical protein